MSNWNNPGYPPPGAYPSQQYPPYPGGPQSGYPQPPGGPQSGYPPPPGGPQSGYSQPPGYPGAPPQGYPQPSYPGVVQPGAPQPGFVSPPLGPYEHNTQQGEEIPFSHRPDMYGTPYEDDQDIKGFGFTDQTIRRGFIRKVFSILCAQLSVTIAFIAWFLFHTPTRIYVQNTPALWIISMVVAFVTVIALTCCEDVRKKSPMNFIFLGIFTLAESFVLGCTASRFDSQEVIMAVGITAAVCFALTIFAFQTKIDFTSWGIFLFIAVVVLFLFGIFAIIFRSKILVLIYASMGALIFCFYLVYDLQMMMGGKHKYSISPEEYIFAALSLYLDITRIFLYILTIIGVSRN